MKEAQLFDVDETPISPVTSIKTIYSEDGESSIADLLDEKVDTDDSRLSDARTPLAHNHDDRYYTESEMDTKLSGKASTSVATTSANGLMSSGDKTKLDGIDTGANKTTVTNSLTSTSTTNALSAAQGKALNTKITTETNTRLDRNNCDSNAAWIDLPQTIGGSGLRTRMGIFDNNTRPFGQVWDGSIVKAHNDCALMSDIELKYTGVSSATTSTTAYTPTLSKDMTLTPGVWILQFAAQSHSFVPDGTFFNFYFENLGDLFENGRAFHTGGGYQANNWREQYITIFSCPDTRNIRGVLSTSNTSGLSMTLEVVALRLRPF